MTITQLAKRAMSDTPPPVPNTAATSSPNTPQQTKPAGKKRGRKKPEDALKALEEQQAQITAKIKQQQARIRTNERKIDTRRKIVAGALALEHMEHDPSFKSVMLKLLRDHVKDSDAHLFEE